MNFTADREEFANRADGVQRKGEEYLLGSVKHALHHIGERNWYAALLRRVAVIARTAYKRETGSYTSKGMRAAVAQMLEQAAQSLDKTAEPPKDQFNQRATAIAKSLAAYANAVGTETAADDDPAEIGLEWVTMHDDRVRSAHADADGQVRLPGEFYDVGGYSMSRPGDITVPIELWINCRCALRPVPLLPAVTASNVVASQGEAMTITAAEVAAVETEEDIDISDIEEVDDLEPVPFHGVLCPENMVSGDGRKFAPESMRWRDLPLPLAWQKVNDEGHKGSVVVGHIDNIWRDGDLIQATGEFNMTEEANEVIGLMADKSLRGVSVDVDDATLSFEDEDGNEITFDSLMDSDAKVTQVITDGRICGATLCAIPAFMEASLSLGPPEPEGEGLVDLEEEYANLSDEEKEAAGEFREFPAEERKKQADKGNAMPDGSFPIANVDDLKNAIQAIGRAKDPEAAKAHIKKRARALGAEDLIPDTWGGETAQFVKTEDGPGWITHPVDTERLRRYWTRGAGAAKIRWGVPGDFNRCRQQVAKYVKPQHLSGYCANRHYDALGFWPGRPVAAETVEMGGQAFSLVASAVATKAPPKQWFSDPGLIEPTRLTITTEGHIFGHLAQWDVCHIGNPQGAGICTTAPHSISDYLYFATGVLDTDDGPVPVGQITMGCGHASNGGARVAAAHYDNLGFAVADIAIGEDEYGIWFSGAMRPTATQEQIHDLRASGSVSGDWREMGGNLELIAALAVNVPGFPITPTRIAASAGHQTMLVASGIVVQDSPHRASITEIVAAAVSEHLSKIERQKRMADLKAITKHDPASKMAALADRRG